MTMNLAMLIGNLIMNKVVEEQEISVDFNEIINFVTNVLYLLKNKCLALTIGVCITEKEIENQLSNDSIMEWLREEKKVILKKDKTIEDLIKVYKIEEIEELFHTAYLMGDKLNKGWV